MEAAPALGLAARGLRLGRVECRRAWKTAATRCFQDHGCRKGPKASDLPVLLVLLLREAEQTLELAQVTGIQRP